MIRKTLFAVALSGVAAAANAGDSVRIYADSWGGVGIDYRYSGDHGRDWYRGVPVHDYGYYPAPRYYVPAPRYYAPPPYWYGPPRGWGPGAWSPWVGRPWGYAPAPWRGRPDWDRDRWRGRDHDDRWGDRGNRWGDRDDRWGRGDGDRDGDRWDRHRGR